MAPFLGYFDETRTDIWLYPDRYMALNLKKPGQNIKFSPGFVLKLLETYPEDFELEKIEKRSRQT
jgi:hypothetical protein